MEALKKLLRAEPHIDWLEVEGSVVCNHADGFDYLILREEPENPAAWLAQFKAVDDRRLRFIEALRWTMMWSGHTFVINQSGIARFENPSMSSSLDLGHALSELLGKVDPLKAYDGFSRNNHLPFSEEQWCDALVAGPFAGGPPHAITAGDGKQANGPNTAFFMAAFEPDIMEDFLRSGSVAETAEKHPRWALAARLGQKFGTKFALEITDDSFTIDLDAGGSFKIGKKEIERRLSKQSLDAVIEQICNDYETTNRKRGECKRMLFAHMAALGYAVDERDGIYVFGRTKREFEFDPDNDLPGMDVGANIMIWLLEHDLSTEAPDEPIPFILEKTLPDKEPMTLASLDAYDIAAIDRRAKNLLEAYRRDGVEYPHGRWASPCWHRPDKDRWMTVEWWRTIALKHKDDLMLAVLGDEDARERILKRMKSLGSEPDWNAGFAIYEGFCPLEAWMARDHVWPDENPLNFYQNNESARPAHHYWLRYFESLPYEIKRFARGEVLDVLNDPDEAVRREMIDQVAWALQVFKPAEIEVFFNVEEVGRIHQLCEDIAKGDFAPSAADESLLSIVHQFGWLDVLDALEANESFWWQWDTWPERYVFAGDWALALSMFDRDLLVRRLAAWVLNMGANAPEQVREYMEFCPEQQLKAALAWSRTCPLMS